MQGDVGSVVCADSVWRLSTGLSTESNHQPGKPARKIDRSLFVAKKLLQIAEERPNMTKYSDDSGRTDDETAMAKRASSENTPPQCYGVHMAD